MIVVSLNARRGYAVISVKGTPQLEDFIEACRGLGKHETFEPDFHRVCDFTQIDNLDVSLDDVLKFAEEAKNLPTTSSAKVALVAKPGKDMQYMNLFAEQIKSETQVFETGRDALAWVLWAIPERKDLSAAQKIRTHRLVGDVFGIQVVQLQNEWFTASDFDDETPVLWDLSKATIKNSPEDVQVVGKHMVKRSKAHRPKGKAAVLVADNATQVFIEEAFREGIEADRLLVTRDSEEATKWLT